MSAPLTYDECMARLMACPALPRGERLAWVLNLDGSRGEPWHSDGAMWGRCFKHAKYRFKETERFWREAASMASTLSTQAHQAGCDRWRSVSAPLRHAREERRRLRETVMDLFHAGSALLRQCEDAVPEDQEFCAWSDAEAEMLKTMNRARCIADRVTIPAAFARMEDGE